MVDRQIISTVVNAVRSRSGAGVRARPGHGRPCPPVLPHPWTYAADAHAPRRNAHCGNRARPCSGARLLPGRGRNLPPVPLVAIGRGNRRVSTNSPGRRTGPGVRPRRPWSGGSPGHAADPRRSSQHRLHGAGPSWASRDDLTNSRRNARRRRSRTPISSRSRSCGRHAREILTTRSRKGCARATTSSSARRRSDSRRSPTSTKLGLTSPPSRPSPIWACWRSCPTSP